MLFQCYITKGPEGGGPPPLRMGYPLTKPLAIAVAHAKREMRLVRKTVSPEL